MAQKSLRNALRACQPDNWKGALTWLGYTLVFGLMPLWAGIINNLINGKNANFSMLIQHGELLTFTTSLVGASTRLISKDGGAEEFVSRQMFTLIALALTLPSAMLFALVRDKAAVASTPTYNPFLTHFSITFAMLSMAFVFFVVLLDSTRSESVRTEDKARVQVENLNDDIDRLVGGN